MTDIDSLAAALFGSKRAESQEVLTDATTRTYVGTALTDSKDGTVMVDLGGDVTLPDDVEGIAEYSADGVEVSTGPGVRAGDEVVVTLVGGTPLKTPMVTGVAGEGDRQDERIHAIEADYVKASTLEADVADIGFLKADSATITGLQADAAKVHNLTADQLSAATAYIATLTANSVTAASLTADVAKVHDLTAQQLSAAAAYIAQLTADSVTAQAIAAMYGDFDDVRANAAKVANLTAAELEADHATIGSLDANYAKITNGHIDSALIDTAAIVDEQVFTVTGNKATLAQIDASKINVLNLKAKDIEVERINGQAVTGKTLVDALTQHESDISDLDSKIDDEVEALNDRIDGAIETFTGTVVPTLNNAPASSWNTTKLKDQHVGDVYYVVNGQSAQNGYCYRFTKSGSTYSWQLIKDSDVTAALSRLQTAEGKISSIEQFDVTVGSFMTDTDDELSSLKTKTTNLETSLGDKVDTSTFNTVSQKVDENSASISTLSETVSTKADSSTVTTLSNTVNTVKQTADTNKTSITNLTQTVSNNKTTIENRATTIEQNLSGITTRVSETESAIETVSNPNLSPYLSHTFGDTDYWRGASNPNKSFELGDIGTYLGDGWMHVDMNNSSRTGYAYLNCFWVNADSNITESTKYTFLVEIRNLTFVSGTKIYVRPTSSNTSASRKGQFGTTYTIEVTESKDIYQVATTRSDFSGCVSISDGYVYVDAGTNASFDIRISLYEGEYSGPYKPYVDQTLINRVKMAETAIEQNAEDITLRATKAEFNALSIGGRNFLINSEAERVVSLTSATGTSFYTEYINESEYGKSVTNENVDDIFVLSFDWTTTSDDGVAWVQVDGNIIANPIDGNGGTSDGSRGKNYLDLGYGSGRYWVAFKYTSTQAGKAQQRVRIRISGAEVSTKPLTANSTFSASHFKLEKGTRPTDWTPAPEDMATAAELKVANDNINLKVSKNDVINQINVSTEGVKIDADRLTIDGTAVFNAISSDVDDAITSKGYQTSSQVNSAITSKGYATTTQAQGYASTAKSEAISAAATDATTKANTAQTAATNAANTATDNKLKSYSTTVQANELYDAKGAAAAAETNSGNLFLGASMADRSTFIKNSSTDFSRHFRYYNGSASIHSFSEYSPGVYQDTVTLESSGNLGIAFARMADEMGLDSTSSYTITCWAKCSKAGMNLAIGLSYYNTSNSWVWQGGTNATAFSAADTWQKFSLTFKPDADTKAICYCFTVAGGTGSETFTIRNCWLEKNAAHDAQVIAENAAPKANAVKRTQRIWYRTNASGAPSTPGTASSNWVTRADDGNDAWTKMHIAISSTHKYIYTCEQYEMANGTVGYTSVLLDNTITVIDGGNLITGSVKANTLDAADINASKTLTVGAMTDAAASTILNSNVQVGGRNLLTGTVDWSGSHQSPSGSGSSSGDTFTFSAHTSLAWYSVSLSYPHMPFSDVDGQTLTLGFDYRSDDFSDTSGDHRIYINAAASATETGGRSKYRQISTSEFDGVFVPTTEWQRGSITFVLSEALFNAGSGECNYFFIQFYNHTLNSLQLRHVKLERGNKATDWSPAPEDMATAESLAGTNESLEGAIEDIGELSDQLVGTVTEQNKTITDIQTYLNSLRKDLDAEIQSRQQWLNFNSAEGLVIGAAGSSFKTVTTNTSQQFRSGGTVLAETSGTEFVAPVMRSDQLLIGNWMWTRRDNGNLSLKWIG